MVTSTAREVFDCETNQIKQTAVNILVSDRALAARLELTWPEEGSRSAQLQSTETESGPPRLTLQLSQLTPPNELQHGLQSQALQLVGESFKARKMAMAELEITIPGPFLILELDTPFSGLM